jgi:iron(III) transport system ATP-binding protein
VSAIELEHVVKRFGATPVLNDVGLSVASGSITAVLGPSGSGKTTLLRLIAGFERLDTGSISIGGQVLDDSRLVVRAQHRGVGFVPQDGALFPHLTALGNVAFGLARADRSVAEGLLERVGLGGLGRRYPHQLSGGEQQRVALARALAISPRVVLLDEPFSGLDAGLRTSLGREVIEILRTEGTTTLLVTHDQSEALALADQVAVLDDGRIVALDDPRALYRDPAGVVAARSIGEANLLSATFDGDGQARCALGLVAFEGAVPDGPSGQLLLRPEQLRLHAAPYAGAAAATLERLYYQGHDALAYLRLGEELLLARVPGTITAAAGDSVWVEVLGAGRVLAPDPARPGSEPG